MAKPKLTIALERHDRHIPFFMDAVQPPEGYEIVPLEIGVGELPGRRDGRDRHGRMFRDGEFDICEQSLSSYIIAKSRGAAFTAAPVFPRRLFGQSCMYVNRDAGIESPADLAGKRIGILSFQTTLCVQAKGDLKQEYGVPWENIDWLVQSDEELSFEGADGVSIEKIAPGKNIGQMLIDGEIAAMFHPNPQPAVLARTDRVRRLFPDAKSESIRYFRKYGYCPIMHIMVFPEELVDREPWLPIATIDMWEQAKQVANTYYDDPNYTLLLFARNELEAQRETLGPDPWPSGLAANRANLERFIEYVADQKLIESPMPVENLFHPSVLDT